MTTHLPVRDNRPNDELHPLIYQSLIGLTIWLVLSVWGLFSRGAYEGLTLSVITLFFVILVGIPVLLWLTWRRNSDPNEQHIHTEPFGEWISRPFETWTGGISGREAAVQRPLWVISGHYSTKLRDVRFWVISGHYSTKLRDVRFTPKADPSASQ